MTRAARFGDHWRRTFNRDYKVRLENFQLLGLRCLEDSTVEFSKGINAIVGANGVGKSTIAHALVDLLAGEVTVQALASSDARLRGSTLAARAFDNDGEKKLSILSDANGERNVEEPKFSGIYIWLDPSKSALMCQHQILLDPNFQDLLESAGSKTMDQAALDQANYLVGKEYTECKVFEITDYQFIDRFPYFQVKCGGIEYSSENMGQGELSLLMALWTINDAPNNSIVVLEEPETHLSGRSQSALMDILAWASDKKGFWTILTTHSPVVLSKIPRGNIKLLANAGSKSTIISNPFLHQIASIIGGGSTYRNIFLVEDETAKMMTDVLFEQSDADLRRQSEVVFMTGFASIDLILKSFPHIPHWITIAGLYDGDCKETLQTEDFKWPHLFLPGAVAPELLLKSALSDAAGIKFFSEKIDIAEADISAAVNAGLGFDHHDWLANFVHALGRDKLSVVRALTKTWISANEADRSSFIKSVQAAVG